MLLFTYGTLMDREFQKSEFGGYFIDYSSDFVSGFSLEEINIEDKIHLMALPDATSRISGKIFGVGNFIEEIDEYEGGDYKRIMIKTDSGINCWMYVKNN